MNMTSYSTIILISLLFSSTDGQVQLSYISRLSVFMCTDATSSSLNWRIVTSSGIQKILSFNAHFDGIGFIRSKLIGSSLVRAELVYGNATFVSTSLAIDFTVLPMVSTISCNNEIVFFNLTDTYYQSLITIVLYPMTHSDNMYDFRVTLNTPKDRLDYYYITVVRISTGGSVYRTISHQTSTLSLSNDVMYNVSISAGPFMKSTSHFVIGQCPFLPLLSENNVSYIISANGNTTLFMRCLNGEIYYINCGRNGEWVTSTADICNNTFHNESNKRRVNLTSISTLTTPEFTVPLSFTVTSTKEVYSKSMTCDENESSQLSEKRTLNCGPVMAGLLSGGFAFTVFLSTVIFLLGVVCGVKSMEKKIKTKESDSKDKTVEPEDSVVYEELDVKSFKLKTVENIAYGEVMR